MRVTTRRTTPKSFYSWPRQPHSTTTLYGIHQHKPRHSYEYGYRTGLGNSRGESGYSDGLDVEDLDLGAISGTFCSHFLLFLPPFSFLPSCWGWPPACGARSPLVEVACRLWLHVASTLVLPVVSLRHVFPSILPHVEDHQPSVVSFGRIFSFSSFSSLQTSTL